MQDKLSTMSMSGGQAMEQLQSELETAQAECKALNAQLAELHQTLSYEQEKLHSLESTMSNFSAGNEANHARTEGCGAACGAAARARRAAQSGTAYSRRCIQKH